METLFASTSVTRRDLCALLARAVPSLRRGVLQVYYMCNTYLCVYIYVCVCVCARARVCVRARACVCARACECVT